VKGTLVGRPKKHDETDGEFDAAAGQPKDIKVEVAIIGGGAAGLMAALSAGLRDSTVALLEASDRVGHTILRTGNGHCNYTNRMLDNPEAMELYHNAEFAHSVLTRCNYSFIQNMFYNIGILAAPEMPEGRVYPRTYTASSIVDSLRLECKREGVLEVTGFMAQTLEPLDRDGKPLSLEQASSKRAPLWRITAQDGRTVEAKSVIVATGGGESLLVSLGHKTTALRPGLCALATDTARIRGLDGVRCNSVVSLFDDADSAKPVAVEAGEVLFRKYGVSGIVIFNMSRFAHEGSRLELDLMPEFNEVRVAGLLESRMQGFPSRNVSELLTGVFQKQVASALLKRIGVKLNSPGSVIDVVRLAHTIKHFELTVTGPANVENAQVTCGGLDVSQFNPETLESKLFPGLFAAGEVLDVDGPCGGWNLHWAWGSGFIAGALSSVAVDTQAVW
jgi:predicted Rossmann fold flavoprotein